MTWNIWQMKKCHVAFLVKINQKSTKRLEKGKKTHGILPNCLAFSPKCSSPIVNYDHYSFVLRPTPTSRLSPLTHSKHHHLKFLSNISVLFKVPCSFLSFKIWDFWNHFLKFLNSDFSDLWGFLLKWITVEIVVELWFSDLRNHSQVLVSFDFRSPSPSLFITTLKQFFVIGNLA